MYMCTMVDVIDLINNLSCNKIDIEKYKATKDNDSNMRLKSNDNRGSQNTSAGRLEGNENEFLAHSASYYNQYDTYANSSNDNEIDIHKYSDDYFEYNIINGNQIELKKLKKEILFHHILRGCR